MARHEFAGVKWMTKASKVRVTVAVLGLATAASFVYLEPLAVLGAATSLHLRFDGVRSREVQAGPYRLRCYEKGSGEPLVLVHGLGSNAVQDWGRLLGPLGRRFHVYAPDLPGFGDSEQPADASYSIPMQVEALRLFGEAVGVSRARVAGLSMGGWIAARFAALYPERVERLVVVDPAGMRPDTEAVRVEVLFPHSEDGVRQLIAAVRHVPPATPSFVARAILARMRRNEWVVRRAVDSMRQGHDWLNGTLARADMPVLVLWGKQDRLIPVVYGTQIEAEFPRAELRVLDGCGHVPMADCPEAFDREFVPFLEAAIPRLRQKDPTGAPRPSPGGDDAPRSPAGAVQPGAVQPGAPAT